MTAVLVERTGEAPDLSRMMASTGSGQLWHCLANVLKPSENRGSSALLRYQSWCGIAPPGRNVSGKGLDLVWKKLEW